MLQKIKYKILNLLCRIIYGGFGKGSIIINPMRIINPKHIYIGNRVTILNNARMEAERGWQDVKLNGEIIIGDGTSIEQGCHIIASDKLNIGKDCVISANVYISDCAHEYEDITTSIMKQPLIIKKTIIGDSVFIGIGAKIMPGVRLGEYCVIGANSVVTKDIPAFCVATGIPAKIIKRYNVNSCVWEKVSSQ